MSLFGIDVTGAGQVIAPAQSQQGVVDKTKGSMIQAIGQQVTNVANVISGVSQQQQEAAKGQVLSDYALKLNQIAQKVEQGMSRSDARSMIRDIYSQTVQSYGSTMLEDINALHKQVTSASGLATNLEGDSFQQQLVNKEIRGAVESGFVNPTMPLDAQENGLALYREQQSLNSQVAFLESQQKVDKFKYQEVARQQAGVSFANADNKINELIQAQKNGAQFDPKQLAVAAQQVMSKFEADMALFAGKDVDTSPYNQVMQNKVKTYIDIASGKLEADMIEKKMALSEKQNQMAFREGNPELAAKMDNAKILGAAGAPLISLMTPEATVALDLLTSDPEKTGGGGLNLVDTNKEAQRTSFNMTKESMAKMNAGGNMTDREGVDREVRNVINNSIRGVNAYQLAADKPDDYTEFVGFIASDEFANYIKGGTFKLDAAAAEQAKMVVKQVYETGVVDVAAEYFDNVKIETNNVLKTRTTMSGVQFKDYEKKPATEVFIPELVGGKIVFKVSSDEFNSEQARDLTRTGFFARLSGSMNKKGGVGDMMSMSMRVNTHLGRQISDYEPEFRDIMGRVGFKKVIIDGEVVELGGSTEE